MEFLFVSLLLQIFSTYGYDNLSVGKITTQSSLWTCHSQLCNLYASNNAVDGNMSTCMRADTIGLSNSSKTVWWRVDLGDIKSIYSIRIQFKDYGADSNKRQRGRLAGFSLFVSNTTEIRNSYLCYKDGPELPLLNFIIVCSIKGRFVTYYNERISGVTYPDEYQTTGVVTELCEVQVLACENGFYGQNCSKQCSNCLNNKCNPFNGNCIEGCKNGYISHRCENPCANGRFGKNCSEICSDNCRKRSCDNIHGGCTFGCKAGWIGFNCSEICWHGWYGEDCLKQCGKCAFNQTCNKTNGLCLIGCAEPFTGEKCDRNMASLEPALTIFSEREFYGYVISLSIGLALLLLINLSLCSLLLRRKYKSRRNEGPPHYTECIEEPAVNTCTHTYQELSDVNHLNTYNNLSFQTTIER
ncbi:uncharacterized protein LOC134249391 [Saccostrea cucullata]|uniref:uncharacterized protein LOC134249391 n=1 Tax=Saccostrea cuccullata TaxID=36930 RepID=UPI002ED07FF8